MICSHTKVVVVEATLVQDLWEAVVLVHETVVREVVVG